MCCWSVVRGAQIDEAPGEDKAALVGIEFSPAGPQGEVRSGGLVDVVVG
jgi:hypothetical protein